MHRAGQPVNVGSEDFLKKYIDFFIKKMAPALTAGATATDGQAARGRQRAGTATDLNSVRRVRLQAKE